MKSAGKIKAVVFDYGKVICYEPDDSVWGKIAGLAGTDWNILDPVYRKYRSDYDRGIYTASAYYRKILDELNLDAEEENVIKMGNLDLDSWKNINPETVELMEEIKGAGLLLGILSNMPFDFLGFARKELPVFSLPHLSLFSSEAGCIKPEKEIYLKLLDGLKCLPEETVFFDDVPVNVNAAGELGIEARLWENCGKARRDLADLGVE